MGTLAVGTKTLHGIKRVPQWNLIVVQVSIPIDYSIKYWVRGRKAARFIFPRLPFVQSAQQSAERNGHTNKPTGLYSVVVDSYEYIHVVLLLSATNSDFSLN